MLTDQFLDYINKEKLFKPADKLLLAISGGVDSVVLAHLLSQIKQPFALAHMNFNLRGRASNDDAKFVKQFADTLKVPFHLKEVTIDSSLKGKSTQMQARDLRYEWFEQLLRENGYNYLLTAHHSNDSFETVLLNLVRGTGIKGLRGILPKKAQLIRPLLFSTKEDLLDYAKQNDLSWREDASNATADYKRNFMRHKVVPLLVQQNPNLLNHFHATSQRLSAAEGAFMQLCQQYKEKYVRQLNESTYIDKALLQERDGLVFLHEVIKGYGFSFNQINSFDFSRVGALLYSTQFELNVDRAHLIISLSDGNDKNPDIAMLQLTEGVHHHPLFTLKVDVLINNSIQLNENPFTVCIDKRLITQEVKIRRWLEGDKFQPLGMKGQKKVSDYLIDEKVPLSLKKHQLVMTHAGEIVWLIGHRINDKYKITQQTDSQLRISYSKLYKSNQKISEEQ